MALGIATLYPSSGNSDIDNDVNSGLFVDIISIHGLNGNLLRTWTDPITNKLWQRDFLPLDLPKARILTFGYDAQAVFGTSTGGVVEHSRALLCELLEIREGERSRGIGTKRPIIFIGHSLGGLVIKRALIIARQEPIYINIYQSLRGVIFFGTPHQGSSLASYASHLLQIPTVIAIKPSPVLLETLVKKSDILVHLMDEYREHHESNPYPIVSFYETVVMKLLGTLVVQKDSALLTPPGEIPTYEDQIPVAANHTEMCRFASPKDKTYKAVIRSIRRMLTETNNSDIKNEYFLVPATLSNNFTGRHNIRQLLVDSLLVVECAQRQKVFVLYGMGGSGKTQQCLKFANDYQDKFWAVFFIDASSMESIEQGFFNIARNFRLKESMESVKEWLCEKAHWLLIIDNADDPGLDMSRLIPPGPNGTILITTRNPDLQKFGSFGTYKMDEMDQEDAVTLLLKAAAVEDPGHETVRKSAERVVLQLGNLALAIVQAAAVIRQKICNLDSFCAIFSKQKKDLLEIGRPNSRLEYQHSVFTTWEISRRQIETMTDNHAIIALELLGIFSFMHFDDIGEDIFQRSQATWQFLQTNHCPCWILEGSVMVKMMSTEWNSLLWAKAIGLLAGFSLVSVSNASRISIHPLVHEWSRDRMSPNEKKQNRELTLMIMSQSTNAEFYSQKYVQRKPLLLHADACLLTRIEDILDEDSNLHERVIAISELATLYRSCNRYKTALGLFTLYLEHLSKTKFDTTYRENEYFRIKILMGACLTLDGQYNKSIEFQEALLMELQNAQRTRQVLDLKCHLGAAYNESGEFQKTIDICNGVLEESKKFPDEEILIEEAEERIGNALLGLNRPKQALQHHQKVLEIRKRKLGEQNELTITSYLCISQCYDRMSRYKKSAAINAKCLIMSRNIEGEEHRQTALALNSLANSTMFPTKSSLLLKEEALVLYRTIMGDNHPHTLTCMADLGSGYVTLGRYAKALPFQEEVLRLREKHLGPDHVSTARARKALARTRRLMAARNIFQFWVPKKRSSLPDMLS